MVALNKACGTDNIGVFVISEVVDGLVVLGTKDVV